MKDLVNYFGRCVVTHNGMKVDFCYSGVEVLSLISERLKSYKHLSPRLIVDTYVGDNSIVIIYEYSTMYKEMFFIQFENDN